MLQKYQNYGLKLGRCYHTTMVTNDYYQASVCLAFLIANPEIMEKKAGVGFFFDKPKNLRLATKKTHPLGGFSEEPL